MTRIDAPLLSVIMTVYNGEKFLNETLDAIFAQSFTDFELIVVNNGCTDSTQGILDSYDDQRLRVIQQSKQKPTFGDGIRLAYDNACGKFIAVNDGDDVPELDRFASQVEVLSGNEDVALVSGGFEEIDEEGNHIQRCQPPVQLADLKTAFQSSNPLAHSTYMYRKAVTDQVGGYTEKYHYGSDMALVLAVIRAGWGVKILNQSVLKLRVHAAQASQISTLGVMRAYEAKELFKEAANLPGLTPEACKIGRKNLTKRTIQYALELNAEKRFSEALGQFFEALVKSPVYGSIYALFRLGCALGIVKHPVYSNVKLNS